MEETSSCNPPVEAVFFGAKEQPEISARMLALFEADQAARQIAFEFIDWNVVGKADAERRYEVMRYLCAGEIAAAESLYCAAFIFQHGDCTAHYDLAHYLAAESIARGNAKAKWIYAASCNRALVR
jgi:hypothetical protein